jgi:hypothetical protein
MTTRIAPGISVPTTVPRDASLAISPSPRDETRTLAQNSTMITAAVQTPLSARLGSMMYARVLPTYASSVG